MYKKLHPSRYKKDAGGNNEMLITVWLEAKDELRSILRSMLRSHNNNTESESHDLYAIMALQLSFFLDVNPVKYIMI